MAYPGMALSDSRLRVRDEFLDVAAADLLAHDARLPDLDVRVQFDRGVAHLTGAAPDAATLLLVRRLIGRIDGVLAVWDRVRIDGRCPLIVDLGCGDSLQYPDNIGIDRNLSKSCAAVADLSRGLPLVDRSVDRIFTVHVLEHLVDYLPLLDECHRALRPGGILHVLAPWWRHVNAVADPTHIRLFDVQTIKGVLSPPSGRRWLPLHVGCDGATVFADLVAQPDGVDHDPAELARFFD